jgi:hypothetical protein
MTGRLEGALPFLVNRVAFDQFFKPCFFLKEVDFGLDETCFVWIGLKLFSGKKMTSPALINSPATSPRKVLAIALGLTNLLLTIDLLKLITLIS